MVIYLVEEIQNVFLFYNDCTNIQSLAKKQSIFKNLSPEEKKGVEKFYDARTQALDKAQKFICRESSIQLALQLTLILYQEILINFFVKMVINFTFFTFEIQD